MTNTEESLSIAEALQRISDLTAQARREEAARQTDILEGLGALEAAETELASLKAKARVAADGEAAVRALVTLGCDRATSARTTLVRAHAFAAATLKITT